MSGRGAEVVCCSWALLGPAGRASARQDIGPDRPDSDAGRAGTDVISPT